MLGVGSRPAADPARTWAAVPCAFLEDDVHENLLARLILFEFYLAGKLQPEEGVLWITTGDIARAVGGRFNNAAWEPTLTSVRRALEALRRADLINFEPANKSDWESLSVRNPSPWRHGALKVTLVGYESWQIRRGSPVTEPKRKQGQSKPVTSATATRHQRDGDPAGEGVPNGSQGNEIGSDTNCTRHQRGADPSPASRQPVSALTYSGDLGTVGQKEPPVRPLSPRDFELVRGRCLAIVRAASGGRILTVTDPEARRMADFVAMLEARGVGVLKDDELWNEAIQAVTPGGTCRFRPKSGTSPCRFAAGVIRRRLEIRTYCSAQEAHRSEELERMRARLDDIRAQQARDRAEAAASNERWKESKEGQLQAELLSLGGSCADVGILMAEHGLSFEGALELAIEKQKGAEGESDPPSAPEKSH